MLAPALLVAQDLTVRYGATTGLDGVDLDLRAGEVHAVVGENGAGKSTLLRAIAGIVRPCAGQIARGAALAWVPQETLLPPDLTAAEWIFLGDELCGPLGWLRRAKMRDAATETLRTLGADIGSDAACGTLSAPQRKLVQLARALRMQPDVLLLDEPTAVLGDAETRQLFRAVRDLKARGAAVLYVSHRLDEVLAIADRVTVLRDGRWVSTDPVGTIDTAMLVHRMVGRDIAARTRADRTPGEPVLQVSDLATAHVHCLSLTVRRGEVVGLAGLVGAGRSETLEAIAGVRRVTSGQVECATPPALVPEDRARNGLVPTLTVRENVFLPADRTWLRRRDERLTLARWMNRLRIHARSTEAAIDSLSGGNQQKLLLVRALRHQPQLLLLDEPTAGVDVGAKAEIHELIRQLTASGAGILLASSDLPELLLLCDRIVALRDGCAVGEVAAADASEPRLAGLITGAIGEAP
jgi:rhamnose transport system ATP-binding protein